MNRQSILFAGGVALILVLAFVWVQANKIYNVPQAEMEVISEEGDVCKSSKEEDRRICLANVERALFENYLRSNISELSPEKEVLGGKFYITNISWLPERMAIVDYEDGHIALKARVVLDAKYHNGWPEMVEVKSFEIIKQ